MDHIPKANEPAYVWFLVIYMILCVATKYFSSMAVHAVLGALLANRLEEGLRCSQRRPSCRKARHTFAVLRCCLGNLSVRSWFRCWSAKACVPAVSRTVSSIIFVLSSTKTVYLSWECELKLHFRLFF